MSSSAYRLFDVTVAEVARPAPGFLRVVFTGDALDEFGFGGVDQRIKLILPNRLGEIPRFEATDGWYQAWAAMSDDERPPLRTYTPRSLTRGDAGVRLTIDFARHDAHPGPASAWAEAARPGDRLMVFGPDARFTGPNTAIGWIPPRGAQRFLIVGDDTALPAIAGILESLDPEAPTRVIVELGDPADARMLGEPERLAASGLELVVCARDPEQPGAALVDAVRGLEQVFPGGAEPEARAAGAAPEPELRDVDVDAEILWEVPGLDDTTGAFLDDDARQSEGYAWLAGEAGAIKLIRRALVSERGIDRQSVAFMGYWRRGKAEN